MGVGDTERGAEAAVAELNAKDGVLGKQIKLIAADDYCDSAQTVAPSTSWSAPASSHVGPPVLGCGR